jgi:K+-transporting ATPase ATPase A chain
LFFALLVLVAKPLGTLMAKVFEGERTFLHPVLGWLERGVYKLLRIDPDDDQPWQKYALSMLAFSFVSFLATYVLLRVQGLLPLNPQNYGGDQMQPHTAFNIASSFMTNTNWQNYSPELSISYFSNMVALAFQNWASAAAGIAIVVALIRGFSRKSASGIGNFWVDAVRGTIYVLLPICFLSAIVLVWQGVPQSFQPYQEITTVEGGKQMVALGAVASQLAIKQFGSNGGGIFNMNSAQPLENPSNFTNLIESFALLAIAAGLVYMFGVMVRDRRQGWAVFAAMSAMLLAGIFACTIAEQAGNPHFTQLGVEAANMEGKEVRHGIGASAIWAASTTAASNGSVNSMHDSYTPIGGLVPLFNMQTGEVIFGGVGAGLYGMLIFAILAVFIGGLMVGRTPEYLGKKIQKFEVQMSMIAILACAASILGFTAIASVIDFPTEGPQATYNTWPGSAYGGSDNAYGPATGNVNNPGAHGFSEILYGYSSQTGNNGSAFAGITWNTPCYNLTGGLAMLIGRFLIILPVLAIAGNLARKKKVPVTAGTFPTHGGTFVGLLVGVVILVGALTYLPALALGPIVEHYQMQELQTK